jgi:hypothetical protein
MATVSIQATPTDVDGATTATLTGPTVLAGTTYAAGDTVNITTDATHDPLAGPNIARLFYFTVTTAGTLTLKAPASGPGGPGTGPFHNRAGADVTITFPATGSFLMAIAIGRFMDDTRSVQLVSGTAAGKVQVMRLPLGSG